MQASCVFAEKLEHSAELGLIDADRTHLSPQSPRPEAMASPAVTATHCLSLGLNCVCNVQVGVQPGFEGPQHFSFCIALPAPEAVRSQ